MSINHGATWYPNVRMPVRVTAFETLNTYLGTTDTGRLKHFEDNFPETPDTAKQICRSIGTRDLIDRQYHLE